MSQFSPGIPVKGPSFYGRHRELQAIHRQQRTWVCGQRRIGKSSLLKQAAAEASEREWHPLLWSLDTLPEGGSGEGLLSGFLERHGRTDLAQLGIDVAGLGGGSAAVRFRALIEKLSKLDRKVIFLWDEAEERLLDVAARDPAFIAAISDCFRYERVHWVLAASQLLAGMLRPDDDSFLTAFRWQTLSGLDDHDARALLRGEQASSGWASPLSEHVVSQATSWTGGHPYVLQVLGQALELESAGKGRQVNDEMLRRCQATLIRNEAVQAIFQNDFGRLTDPQQQLLRALCKPDPPATLGQLAAVLKTPAEEVAESLNFLEGYGYVSWGEQIRLRFGFYRDFLSHATAPPSNNAAVVKQIPERLARSDRAAALGKRFSKDGPKRILSLDGGGIRGALTLGFLCKIESILREQHGNPKLRLCDYFDLIGGTSTGAIIATALALGKEVEEVRELYQALGGHIFSKKLPWWKRIFATFPEDPLRASLDKHFGTHVFESDEVLTGLCVFVKRADFNQTFPLHNHPQGRFSGRRRGILLSAAVRASTAAPTYFVPQELEIGRGEVAAFIDGGVSMVNNPALYLFLMATLNQFPFKWRVGHERLLLVSVGTGSWYQRAELRQVVRSKLWDWATRVPNILMDDANLHNQLILQWLSDSPTRSEIDEDFGTLHGDRFGESPAMHYLRYNVSLDVNSLNSLGFSHVADRVVALRDLSDGGNRQLLYEIGAAAAERDVLPEHFPDVFKTSP